MDLSTNIIRNVYNIGTNSCSSGPTYCAEGYALYFPCLKDVTKGQDVCFDFYVADYAGRNELTSDLDSLPDTGKELADLRNVDAISLNLIGAFNCPYGTYSYPDNISSLQTEEYPVIYTNDFGSRKLCHLQVIKIDICDDSDSDDQYNSDVQYYYKEGDYYSGTSVTISADDTPTHIFEGWALFDTDDEGCPDSTIYGDIISIEKQYTFTIENDINIYAIYRPRKVYTIIVDPDNESSYFIVNYKNTDYPLRNKKKEIFNDGFDSVEILEGYHFVAKCIPSADFINNPNPIAYEFVKWSDGNTSRCRLFDVGGDDETIKLKAECVGPVPYFVYKDETILYNDEFDEVGIHIDTEFSDITDYYGDEYTVSSYDVDHKFINGKGYLYFNNKSTLVLSSFNIEDGVKINIHAKSDDSCNITVDVNGYSLTKTISNSEFKDYEFYFSKSNKSVIKISSDGKCLIDLLEVCREEIIDKGKARFCLSSEVTSKLPSGPLSVNGAIAVGELGVDENGELTVNNPQSYGLATTQIGTINRLPKITIN